MNKSKGRRKNKRITPASMVGLAIGLGLIAVGSYQAFVHGNPGAYFVIFLGAAFNALILWSFRG